MNAHPVIQRVAKFLIDHNPFYILSAMCMVVGCFMLNNWLTWSPLPLRNLLLLIGILSVYEWMLVGLGALLLKRGIIRDGTFVLLIEAFFLADVGFLNMEVFGYDPQVGMLVNALLFVMAAGKMYLIFYAAGLKIGGALFPLLLGQIWVLLAVPGLFSEVARHNHGALPALTVYSAWWLAALLPAAYALVLVREEGREARAVAGAFALIPFLSILAHLCLANWVYKVTFYPANVAPVLLGTAVLAGHFSRSVATQARRVWAQLLLPAGALLVSGVWVPTALVLSTGGIIVSPLRATLLGVILVYAEGWWWHREMYFAYAAWACCASAGLSLTAAGLRMSTAQMLRALLAALWDLVPQTRRQWGLISVGSSFLLLAIGAAISLLGRANGAKPVLDPSAGAQA